MSIIISDRNIYHYRIGLYPSITVIRWNCKPLDPDVLSRFPNLQKLNCGGCKLKTLAGIEVCTQLQTLQCQSNNLTDLAGIEACTQLRILHCLFNQITTLAGIEYCPNITDLRCGGNRLKEITEIATLPLLEHLYCTESRLVSLRQIAGHPGLRVLSCSQNELVTLDGIERFPRLEKLVFWDNRLESLAGIENCSLLQELECASNQLTSLDNLVYLRHLRRLLYGRNPLGIQTPQVQRFLTRFNGSIDNRSIYSDSQNVHDVHVQKAVCDSVRCLMADPKPTFTIQDIIDSDLDEHVVRLLLEYCGDETVHSVHLLTYIELLAYVWVRINRHEYRAELFKILAEQVCDSECKCFTGRFNRTLSVLVGFYDDIVITISDNSRIGAIIVAVKDRIRPYDPKEHRSQASQLLLEAGYDADTIEPWLEAIEGSDS